MRAISRHLHSYWQPLVPDVRATKRLRDSDTIKKFPISGKSSLPAGLKIVN